MNNKYEIFEGDPNNAIVFAAWVKWRDQFINAGRTSVSHPDPHVREGAHYFFIKGQTAP
jgi:hypothetical protein